MAAENVMSVWMQMGYVPPRGSCNHGKSILSSGCPCQRFMAHPLKMASSFECDGCGHHASFHNMDNPKDDAVVKRWQEAEREQETHEGAAPRKRPRQAIENGNSSSQLNQLAPSTNGSRPRRVARKATGTRNTRQQGHSQVEAVEVGRILEILDE